MEIFSRAVLLVGGGIVAGNLFILFVVGMGGEAGMSFVLNALMRTSAVKRNRRAAVLAFVHRYHEERPHQGLGNELVTPKTTLTGTGPVQCHQQLGGLLKFYYREAA